jgi:tetratricopeptide (TPR) repeat protein
LYVVSNLPFLVYDGLLQRVSFLPGGWTFSTNYQEWIISYLLETAARWYRKAERQFNAVNDRRGLVEARLALADIERQNRRWSRAEDILRRLSQSAEVQSSPYRTARIRLGEGGVALAQGRLAAAESATTQALEAFRYFQDYSSVGSAASQLARTLRLSGRAEQAAPALLESLSAYRRAGDNLMHTHILWDLEQLNQDAALPDDQQEGITQAIDGVRERYYLARYPRTLLKWFRRLALVVALPLSYLLTLIGGLVLVYSLAILEVFLLGSLGQINLGAIGAGDFLVLVVGALLPVPLALWLYRLIYSVLGMGLVRLLGRRLTPIEREQPDLIITYPEGLVVRRRETEASPEWSWAQVGGMASVDYCLRQHPIQLISGTMLVPAEDRAAPLFTLEGITAGYENLKRDAAARLGTEAPRLDLNFIFLDGRWTLAGLLLSAAYAALVVGLGKSRIGASLSTAAPSDEIVLWFTSFVLMFAPSVLVIFPAGVLWRLVRHRMKLKRETGFRSLAVPTWLLWAAATVSTLFAILWMIFWLVVS